MKKIHVINERWEPKEIAYFKQLGIQVREGRTAISSIRIEDDSYYVCIPCTIDIEKFWGPKPE